MSAKWYAEHRDRKLVYQAQYNADHKDERRIHSANRRAAHPEEERTRCARYKTAHREEERTRSANWVATHREEKRASVTNYHHRKRANGGTFPRATWEYLKALFGQCCAYCRRRMKRLTQDHVIPISKGGWHFSGNIVPACQSCNSRKGASLP